MKYLILLLVFLIGLSQCKQATENKEGTSGAKYTTNVSAISEDNKDSLSRFVKRVEFIPLETNKESVLNEIRELSISDEHIYVLDYPRIKIFDRKGNYVGPVGGQGKGPGEYQFPGPIDWSPVHNSLFVGDFFQNKILEYDPKGNFLKEYSIPEGLGRLQTFVTLDNGNFLINQFKEDQAKENAAVLLMDTNGKILKKFFQEETIHTVFTNNDYTLIRLGNQVLYSPYYSDIVYQFDEKEEEFIPYMHIESPNKPDLNRFEEIAIEITGMARTSSQSGGEVNMVLDRRRELLEEYKAPFGISYFFETDEFLTFQFTYDGGSSANVLLNKSSGTLKAVESLPLVATYQLSTGNAIVRNIFWMYDDPEQNKELMIDLIKDTATEEEIEKIRSLTLEDNPVLAFYYFNQ